VRNPDASDFVVVPSDEVILRARFRRKRAIEDLVALLGTS